MQVVRALLLGLVLSAAALAPVTAQARAAVRLGPSVATGLPLTAHRQPGRQAFAPARDSRDEGLAVGAIAGGLGLGLLVAALCDQSDLAETNCTGATLKGGLLGGTLGGLSGLLLGSFVPKAPRPH